MTTIRRGEQLIGFLRILRDDLPVEPCEAVTGVGYTALATSRDGEAWLRNREPFLDRSHAPWSADRAFAWIYSAIEHGERIWLFYAADDTGHKLGGRRIRLAVLDKDRFAAWMPKPGSPGTLTTRLFQHSSVAESGLWVNADASRGSIRVQMRDEAGCVVEGRAFTDCEPLVSDCLAHRVHFRGNHARLHAGPFRLESALEEAELFGFSFSGSV